MAKINPHKTAIRRTSCSKPVRRLLASGLLTDQTRVLDFGCGWGSDVEWLVGEGIDASGWDPHEAFDRTARPRGKFGIVIAIYVVNVLPSLEERQRALSDAWSFVERNGRLVVVSRSSTEIAAEALAKDWPRHGDGYVSSTAKGTFQKGHDSGELAHMLAALPGAKVEDPPFTDGGFAAAVARRAR